MRRRPGAIPILLLLYALCGLAEATPASGVFFEAGVAAYRDGRYEDALQFFLTARKEGDASEQLVYNLGVTYYRLGDYRSAQASFETLTSYPKAAPLAHYNLGLVALETHRKSEARAQFEQALRTTTRPQLRQLAEQQLQRLSVAVPSGNALYVHLAGGYDDNVALVAETSSAPPALRASWYSLLLAGGEVALTGDRRDGWRLAGSAFRTAYPEASRFSMNSVRAGPQYRARFGKVQTESGVSAVYLTLGGEHFETIGRAGARADYPLGGSQTVSAAYLYEYIEGGSDFADLDGWRQSLRLSHAWYLAPARVSLGYRLELNRRRDFSKGSLFFSTSPTRHRWTAETGWRFNEALRTELRFEYEQSDFNDPDRFPQNFNPVSVVRLDQRYLGLAGVTCTLARNWDLVTEYRYLARDSNIASRDYRSQRYELRMEYRF